MSEALQNAPIVQYLHDTVWQFHTPAGGYDVERLARAGLDHFALAPAALDGIRALAQQVAAGHCPRCGAALQAGGRDCFCCGWSRP